MRRALAMSSVSALALLLAACGSGPARTTPGPRAARRRAAPAGARTAAAVPPSTPVSDHCGDPNAPIDPTALIDDMETPDYMAVRAAGRNGAWWAGGDHDARRAPPSQPNGDAAAESIPGGRCGSQYAMHVTGQGYTMWAVLSVSMGWGSRRRRRDGTAAERRRLPHRRHVLGAHRRHVDRTRSASRSATSTRVPRAGICIDGGCDRRRLLRHVRRRPDRARHRPGSSTASRSAASPSGTSACSAAKLDSEQHLHHRVQLQSGHAVRLLARRHLVLLVRSRPQLR